MKYILGVLLFFFSFACSVGAQDAINVSLSSESVAKGEDFELKIEASSENLEGEIQVHIPGIENFEVFSQGQSYSFTNINGETKASVIYSIQMSATQSGLYTLGPVELVSSGQTLKDDMLLKITVGEDTFPTPTQTSNTAEDVPEEDIKKTLQDSKDIRDIIRGGLPLWAYICSFI